MKKFLIIVMAIFMALILIGGVSASDLNQTADAVSAADDSSSMSVNAVSENSNSVNSSSGLLKAPASQDLLGGSFNDLNSAINGKSGDIVLTEDYIGGGYGDGVYVSNAITSITGNKGGAPVVLDANNNGRIFNIAGNSKITFKNIKFINGHGQSWGSGGAIYVGGNSEVVFEDCTFENNYAGASGAVSIDQSSKANFTRCVFDHNTANGANYLTGSGGALLLSGSGNWIVDCVFSNNKVNTNSGGALVIANTGNHVIDTTFVNNTAVVKAGALWTGNQFHMENVKYINNSAGYGGAIGTEYFALILENSTFSQNHAETEGGAFCVKYNGMIVRNCRFINNTAGTYGGALTFAEQQHQNIEDCYFEGNSAHFGGAIYVYDGGDYWNPNVIRHSEFVRNSAYNGGAIYFSQTGGSNVNGSTFIENIASHNGGALYVVAQDGIHYADYDGFTREGVKRNYGDEFSWSVKVDQITYEYVLKCKFIDNIDYPFAVGTAISGLTAVVSVVVPEADTMTDDAKINLNITYENGTVLQYSFTKEDVKNGVVSVQLSNLAMEEYKVSATFDDGENYFYKIIKDTFEILEPKGDFTILQELIDQTIENYTGTGIPSLFLTRNYIYTPDLDHGQMNITRSIIIYGNGFYIDALNYCRIFKITTDQVSIRDTEFRNGNATGNMSDANPRGGAIYWAGESGYIYRSTFTNNSARDGGAVFVNARSGQGLINESTFFKNTAQNNGGAIDWNASGGYLENSLLYDNVASYGGAVFVGASGVSSHIIKTTFKSNNATNRGGAVDWYSSSGDLEDSYFENNHADYGGAVFVGHATDGGKINHTTFVNNTADVRGGAVDWNASKGSVTYSTFTDNEAPYGGAIFVGSYAEGGEILQSTFLRNKAEFNGGAIDWNASSGNVEKSTFNDNEAYNGGAIFVGASGAAGHITDSSFTNNIALNRGGAVDWYASSGEIYNSTFTGNRAYDGGAVFVGKSSDGGKITGSTFTSNIASHKGGAVDWNASSGNLSYSVFNYNEAVNGGAVFVGASTEAGTIYKSNFTGNKASFKGGAIDWNATGGILNESVFRSNSAGYGGAVFVGSSTSGGTIYKSTFDYNVATYNGGAVDWNASKGNLNESTFSNNHAGYGGAVFVGANTDGGTIYKSTFTSNTATYNGGAIDWNASSGNLDSSNFYYNTAYNGGAVFVGASGSAGKIYNSIFEGNNASNRGGAVDWYASSGDLEKSTFISNHAYDGGAVFVGRSTDGGKIIHSTFTSNIADNNGGAVDWNASRGNLSDSVFSYNEAAYGGAIFVGASTTNGLINNSNFTGNKAKYNGGAVDWNASLGNLQNSRFWANTATNGGAVFVGAQGEAGQIINSHFIENTAKLRGGAVDWYASSGDVEDSTFTLNTADYGGAIFVGHQTDGGSVINSVFTSNTATYNGGAIDWNASSGDLESSSFSNNHASYGGAVFVGKQTVNGKIINSNFTSNTADNNGGAVDWNATSGNVEGSIFRDNLANYGGAIFVGQQTSEGKVIKSEFYSNGATYNGGAIDWNASSGDVEESIFERNYANNGGAIFVGTATDNSKIINSSFSYNTATHNGGAIDWNASRGSVEDSTFSRNEATYGGAIFVGKSSSDGYIIRSNFTLNSAVRGGAIDWNASSGHVEDSRFERNDAENGGAIFVGHNADKGTIMNSFFNLNSAVEKGGAVLFNNVSDAKIIGSNFTTNSANDGGAVYIFECDKLLVNQSIFSRNTAINSSGAIQWEGDDGDLYNSEFIDNHAQNADGGAIGWYGGDGCLFNITFSDNKAGRHGGAVYWNQSKKGIVNQSVFNDNVATGNGGALYWNADSQDVIENSTFYHNQAMDGGAILWFDSDGGKIYNNNFTYNIALNNGGAINGNDANNIIIDKNLFDNNRATGYTNFNNIDYGEGGAIYWNNGDNLNITNSNFTRNAAHVKGGALAVYNCDDAVIYNLNFTDSSSDGIAGAMYLKNDNDINIHDVSFKKSSANSNGGAVYFEDTTGLVENTTFDQSTSNWGTAGAIYVDASMNFNNLTVTDSSALNSLGQSIVFAWGESALSNSSINDENAIIIQLGATVNLTKVNNTGCEEALYSVYNGGNLALEKNKFDNLIINAGGQITTQTYTTILDNKTVIVGEGQSVMLNSTIYDDNNNIIVVSNDVGGFTYDYFQFIELKDNKTFTTTYTGKHNYARYDNVAIGKHVISTAWFDEYNLRAGGLINNTLRTGTIIAKANSALNVTVDQVNEGEVVTIKAHLSPSDVTGNVTFKINDKIYTPVIIDETTGIATFILNNVSAGTYTVTATYNGDDLHFNATNSSLFVVKLREIALKIDIANIYYGQNATAVVTTNATNGTCVIIINGRQYSVKIENGIGKVNVTDLKAGNYSAIVIYSVNDYYNYAYNTSNFTVYKLNTTIEATPTVHIDVGGVERVTVTVNDTATGYVKITINGVEYVEKVNGGTANFAITNLPEGEYTDIPVEYIGDDCFNANRTSISFTVGATDNYNIIVIAPDTQEGNNATVYVVMPKDATGNVTIWVDNTVYENVSISSNGIATVNATGLTVGSHTVNVTYAGDSRYASKDSNGTVFNVLKAGNKDYTLNLTVDAGSYGENTVFTVNLPEDISKDINLTIDGKNYTVNVNAGHGTLTLNNLSAGLHEVSLAYGDDKYHNKTNSTRFYIDKAESGIIITNDGNNVIATVAENATGNVTFYVNGKQHTVNIDGNKAVWENVLIPGNNTVVAVYNGDKNYTLSSNSTNLTTDKIQTTVTVTVDSPIDVGNVALINITTTGVLNTTVLVCVGDKTYSVNVTDGKGHLKLSGLSNATYAVNATYAGDDYHIKSNSTAEFTVAKKASSTSVSVENITSGENAVLIITVSDKGNVTVKVGDSLTKTFGVVVGVNEIIIPGLSVGEYDVEVTYNGNYKYLSSNAGAKLNVSVASDESISVEDKGNGTVIIHVPGNATGNVTVKVGNNTYNTTVINGTGIVDLVNESAGTHNITVIYEDGNRTTVFNTTITIAKLDTPVKIDVENVFVGDTVKITVTVPVNTTGLVIIEIDGVKYTNSTVDGNATFYITGLTAGNKTVVATYPGDVNYTFNSTTAKFTVSKRTSTVTSQDIAVTAGETEEIEITVPQNATGWIIVEIGNDTYAVKVTNGKGLLNITPKTSTSMNITYLGDDQYLSSNNTYIITVNKVPSTVKVSVENITVGDKAIINISVDNDATGNVTVSVDGKEYNVTVAGGKAVLVVSGLKVGEYTVDVTYLGDYKYNSNTTSTKFRVSKLNTTGDVVVEDKGNGTVIIHVPGNATGNVTVKIGNDTYNATVINGTAIVNITNSTPGTHNITVIYSGDENHTNITVNSTVTIPKHVTPIKAVTADISVGDTAVITVNVPGNATGNITIEIDGKTYTQPIVEGVARFEIENLTYGTKTVAVNYIGDDNYSGNHTTLNITVNKVKSTVSATIEDSNVGENVTVKVTVHGDATGQVLIDIGGVGYYVNVSKGTGSVEIPRISSGEYDVSVTYLGDDKYLQSHNDTGFKVSKLAPFVIPIVQDIRVGDNEVIRILVPGDATGNVTIVIAGEEYTFTLNEGILGASYSEGDKYFVAISGGNGEIIITGLLKGEYVVSAKYNGDAKYSQVSNTTTFTVSSTLPDIHVSDKGNGTIIVELPENATGNVTVKVGNDTYNVTVINGTAIVDLTNSTPGEHNITVIYSGDDNYDKNVKNTTVTIPKHNTPITVEVKDIYVGDAAIITVTVPDKATGKVSIEINGKTYVSEVKNGKTVFTVPGLAFGDKTVAVKYFDGDDYADNFTTAEFKVYKRPSTVTAKGKNIKVGTDEVITANVPGDATGRVLVDINGVGYYATVINGVAKVIIPELPSGTYTAKVTYEGDDKYLPSTTSITFKVTKSKTPIKAEGDEIDVGEDGKVTVKVPSDATGTVTIKVNGKTYTSEVKNGKAIFKVPGLDMGDYNVNAKYSGNRKYSENSTVTDILVHAHSNHGKYHPSAHVNAGLAKHATGNPVLVLLVILLTLGVSQIRRFRK